MKRLLCSALATLTVSASLAAPAQASCPKDIQDSCQTGAYIQQFCGESGCTTPLTRAQLLTRVTSALFPSGLEENVLCKMTDILGSCGVLSPSCPGKPDSAETPDHTPDDAAPPAALPGDDASAPDSGTDAPVQSAEEALKSEVVRLVNVERAKEGLAPLSTYDSLSSAAQIRASEIMTLFSHDRPNGSSCFTALDETGAKQGAYTYGENIAAGYATAAETVAQWMNSPGHRANIMSEKFTHIGIGYAAGGSYGHYWVQMFTGIR